MPGELLGKPGLCQVVPLDAEQACHGRRQRRHTVVAHGEYVQRDKVSNGVWQRGHRIGVEAEVDEGPQVANRRRKLLREVSSPANMIVGEYWLVGR